MFIIVCNGGEHRAPLVKQVKELDKQSSKFNKRCLVTRRHHGETLYSGVHIIKPPPPQEIWLI